MLELICGDFRSSWRAELPRNQIESLNAIALVRMASGQFGGNRAGLSAAEVA